jgi:peptidoglycan/LPS O-acetylase OafA/YrhL
MNAERSRGIRSALQIAVVTGMLLVIMLLLQRILHPGMALPLGLAAYIFGGFVAGAKARKPVQQAATAGALAYLGFLVYLACYGSERSSPETPFAPFCSILVAASLAALGGGLAGAVLPSEPPRAPEGCCPRCGYHLGGNISGTCPGCGTPTQER